VDFHVSRLGDEYVRWATLISHETLVPAGLVVRFWLWRRSATGNSADRSGHLSTDVVTSSLKRTDDLLSDPPRQARELFNLGLVHALQYGAASADLKPSTLWAGGRFTLSA
jgi:hypothetical protein